MQGLLRINVCSSEWLLDRWFIVLDFDQIWSSPLRLVPPRVDQGKTKFDKHISIILWRSIRYIDWVEDPSTFRHFSNCQAGIVRWTLSRIPATINNVQCLILSPLSDINNLQVVIKYDELHSSRSDFTETLFSVLCLSDHHHKFDNLTLVWVSNAVSVWSSADSVTQCDNVLEKLINYPRSCWSML